MRSKPCSRKLKQILCYSNIIRSQKQCLITQPKYISFSKQSPKRITTDLQNKNLFKLANSSILSPSASNCKIPTHTFFKIFLLLNQTVIGTWRHGFLLENHQKESTTTINSHHLLPVTTRESICSSCYDDLLYFCYQIILVLVFGGFSKMQWKKNFFLIMCLRES